MIKPVMPFIFIHFFANFLPLELSASTFKPLYELIIQSKCDIELTAFRPSVIAVSGMLLFTAHELPKSYESFKCSIMEINVYAAEKELIYTCYKKLEKLYKPRASGPGFPSIDNSHGAPMHQKKEIEMIQWEDAWNKEDQEAVSAVGDHAADGNGLEGKIIKQAHGYTAVALNFPVGWSKAMKAAEGGAEANDESPAYPDESCIIL